MKQTNLASKLEKLATSTLVSSLTGIQRGIEREALRIQPSGKIAKTPHPEGVGHPLTHSSITTDFSESLLEFITPVSTSAEQTLSQLRDLQKYTLANMGDEMLWPMSMPCFIEDQQDIVLAQFGNSNIGKMKTLYREGLKNRYGSMMQAIAGVHFNISFPESFWLALQESEQDNSELQNFISNKYLGLIRNFKRELWLISYLFGASPALCSSFLQGKESNLPFEKQGKGTLYLPHGTALRLGDLGYTNSEQSSLKVMYNSLTEYVAGLQRAIRCRSDLYENIDDFHAETPKQLNKNILQIENEFYSPIRPKRNAKKHETPTQALSRGGIEYIEIRALDVNPFSDTGISIEQIRFLDVFLTYCLLKDAPEMSWEEQQISDQNLQSVISTGRDTSTLLKQGEEQVTIAQWGNEIFTELKEIAELFDAAHGNSDYSDTVHHLATWIENPDNTFSGQLISSLLANGGDASEQALDIATRYKNEHLKTDFQYYCEADLDKQASQSFEDEKAVAANDALSFKAFLKDYFEKA
ncbi:glutamate--cysteine ligase [Pseudoalteromonas luteoviolacea]|uniref:Glutamate--cysteine ligase n=1 Tax=Pseudoalteromonas luteoviolacea TaxID=43657 RepID=A0A1C0TM36_9GAMM|nr:glutamate--cysteine ligase [Pseudoalteromonas luteoviolacea]OCQ19948.1 glutamate--cysteine ligase [Pseudoalteromonas luteoviolacea]